MLCSILPAYTTWVKGVSFWLPQTLQLHTAIVTKEGQEPTLLTARNDGMVNSFNPVQLSAWRANVDMQYTLSRRKVIEYCTKYVTKSEPRSQSLKEVFTTIIRSLKDGQCRSCSSTVSERETTQLRTLATSSYSYQCSRPHESLSFSALMDPVLLKSILRNSTTLLSSPFLTTTCPDCF